MARGELGMLLAVRLLQDSFRGSGRRIRLPVCEGTTINMVLPVDPYASPLEKIRRGLSKKYPELREATRPDLLVACIQVVPNIGTQIHLVPLEVKFREGRMTAQEKSAALAQANSLGDLLHCLYRATPLSELWKICGLGFLSEILDYGFRVYGDPAVTGKSPEKWVENHQACLEEVASGKARITVAQEGRLLVFDETSYSEVLDTDGDGFEEDACSFPR